MRKAVVIGLFFALWNTAAAEDQTNFEALVEQASAARADNDAPKAIELYSEALKINPEWTQGWWFLGFLQYGAGSYGAATDALTHFIALTPEPGPALGLRGLCEFETGQYTESLADIQASMSSGIANQPRSEQFFRSREALLLTKLGRFDDALKAYAFFAQRRITDPELLIGTGLAALQRPLLPREISNDKELLTAVGSAVFRFLVGDQQTAEEEFQSVFQRFPGTPNAHYIYGIFLFAFDPEAALSEFNRELKLDVDNENAQVMVAWTLLMQRKPDAALPYAHVAEQRQPNRATAQLVLGRALVETGNIKEGLNHLQAALRIAPQDLEVHIGMAEAYSRSGDRQDAQRERELCLQMTEDGINRIALP